MENNIIPLDQLSQYNVNRPDQVEVIRQSLYDFTTYAQAGQTQLQFFQTPKGQSSKTFADTNMTNAGMLPSPQSFLVENIQIYLFPAVAELAGIGASTLHDDFIKDVYNVMTTGWLELFIGSKPYLDEAPLMKFPPANGLSGYAALSDTTTAAADKNAWISYASNSGPIYEMSPQLLIPPTQNFVVTLNWPTAQAITAAARIGVVMGGVLYRNSQ